MECIPHRLAFIASSFCTLSQQPQDGELSPSRGIFTASLSPARFRRASLPPPETAGRFPQPASLILVSPVTGTTNGLFSSRTYIDTIRAHMETGAIDIFTVNNMNFNELAECGHLGLLEAQKTNAETYPFVNEALPPTAPYMFSRSYFLLWCFVTIGSISVRRSCLSRIPAGSGTTSFELRNGLPSLTRSTAFTFSKYRKTVGRFFCCKAGNPFTREGNRLSNLRGTRLMEGIRLCGELIRNYAAFLRRHDREQAFRTKRSGTAVRRLYVLEEGSGLNSQAYAEHSRYEAGRRRAVPRGMPTEPTETFFFVSRNYPLVPTSFGNECTGPDIRAFASFAENILVRPHRRGNVQRSPGNPSLQVTVWYDHNPQQ
ncbi:MAG: hypothetical protein K0R28_4632 [Paenibacillus sp.]|nr:hypothetical protein [Paenibacillus sp.]